MKPLSLKWMAQIVGGCLIATKNIGDLAVDAIVTDTRKLTGEASGVPLFVALVGENFDGNDYVARAAALGARAALVSRYADDAIGADGVVPQIVVDNTEIALARLATAMQRVRPAKTIAITGSNGKTSVKTLTAAIAEAAAAAQHGRAYATPGNRNNEIGLPLAVIDAPEDAVYAIYEMGTGKPGDIAYLTAIAPPDAALVNNVAPAHLERMGSLLEIANTKAAVYDDLREDGVAAINADDAFAPYFEVRVATKPNRRVLRFALDANADIGARDIELGEDGSRFVLMTPEGEAEIALSMPGRHNVSNALAAAALAMGAGIPLALIAQGLNAARPVAGRMNLHRLPNGATLIDDSYNANPGSLIAAFDTLANSGGERWLALGDMRELGADAPALHADIGRRAKASGIARLYALGALSASAANAFGEGARTFDDHAALAAALRADLSAASAPHALRVLVKGSRGSAMDAIVKHILADGASGGDAHAA
ncbi:MAG: UDP-N-acetylmuramoyl-tripeptide--D-alanyl-D-alanine ligase [Lysobacter sp.]|nr:MAG: UDP-N-acetylmuramoyl-tripeptide--D-alanyl-D-alanine ligase [Lysobacter sp.]